MKQFAYAGSELKVFENAKRWKAYWMRQIETFVHGDVLEVGAGIGANTTQFAGLGFTHWTCLEPDQALARQISLPSREKHELILGTLADIPAGRRFDSVLYLDVLEHIERDREELQEAANRLNPGGALIVLAPAHQFLYSPFDREIGHYRRYTRGSLRDLSPSGMKLVTLTYLDSAGMLASIGNRMLLKSAAPTSKQIQVWDTILVPISKFTDRMFGGRIGKSVLGIWIKSR